MRVSESLTERFWARVDKSGECWLWTGGVGSHGYGVIGVPGHKTITTHRFSAMLHFGMFDRRLHVLHRCDVKRCIRPSHIYLGTHAQNMKDAWDRVRPRPTHCPRGHEYAVYRYNTKNGRSQCRECKREDYVPHPWPDHCPKGHEYTEENTYIWPKKPSERRCRECRRQSDRARKEASCA